jgi:hypothetical protein
VVTLQSPRIRAFIHSSTVSAPVPFFLLLMPSIQQSIIHTIYKTRSVWTNKSLSFHTCIPRKQVYFDTFKFVERLEKEGFSTEQSEAIMNSLQKVISESMTDLARIMVSKAEREKVTKSYSFPPL